MDEREYKYDAFISYRHAKPDQFVAENLHKLLETFKVPRIAADSVKKQKKNKINRVFRDRDELPLSSSLSDNIQEALETSEFLIVVCSPRTPESLWVQKEISTFISLHGRERVLAVLVEGEPQDSFPEALRFEEVESVLEDGTKTVEKRDVEPLAADIRGKNQKEVLKNLKRELLRIVAPLLGCSYDDLKQRHRERKIKRMMTASLVAAAVFLLFGSISTAMALRIQKQATVIKEQSEKIEEQYNEVLTRQAYSLADTSAQLLQSGDRIAAILVAKETLAEMPYTEQAQYALTEALRVYENGSAILPTHLLKMRTNIDFFKISPEGNRIMTVDITGQITVWDAESGNELCSLFSAPVLGMQEEEEYGFIDEDSIIFPQEEEAIIYNIVEEKELFRYPFYIGYDFTVYGETQMLALADYTKLTILDYTDGEAFMEYTPDVAWDWINHMTFNDEGTLLALGTGSSTQSGQIFVLDVQGKTCISHTVFEEKSIIDILFAGENELVVASQAAFTDITDVKNGYIDLIVARTGEAKWTVHLEETWMESLQLLDNKKTLLCCTNSGITTFSMQDGSEMISSVFDSEITGYVPIKDEDILLMLRDGSVVYIFCDTGMNYDYSNVFQANSNNLKEFSYGASFYITLPHNSNAVTIYKSTIGNEVEGIAAFSNSIYTAVFDKEGKTYLVLPFGNFEEETAFLVDSKTKEKLAGYKLDTSIAAAFFAGKEDEQIGLLTTDALFLYDRQGNLLLQTEFESFVEELISVSEDGSRIILHMDEGLQCIDVTSGEIVTEFPLADADAFMAVGKKQQYCAMVSGQEGELQVFDFQTAEKQQSIPINSAFVSDIFIDEEEQYIFVVYRDKSVEVYSRETLEMKHTFTEFQTEISDCKSSAKNQVFILYGITEGYICTADNFEIIARIPRFNDISSDGTTILISRNSELAKVPFYNVDALIKEADRQLDGRILSEEERERYHLGELSE